MPVYTIPNLGNACRLLRFLSDKKEPLSITQMSQALHLPRTTCLRIVHTLTAEGFLREQGAGYVLGGGLIPLGLKALQDLDLYTQANPVLRKLTERTGETTHLAVWNDGRAMILTVCDSPHPLSAASRPGTRAYANCSATGKVIMAFNYLERIDEVVPLSERLKCTANSIMDTEALKVELRRVQAMGYAMDNEEYNEGVRCIAAPVRNARGEVCAALGLTASTLRFPTDKIPLFAHEVIAAGNELSAQLGWTLTPAKS